MRYTVCIQADFETFESLPPSVAIDPAEAGTDIDRALEIIEQVYREAADRLIYLALAQWRFATPKLTGALTAAMQAFVNSHIDYANERVYIYLDFSFKRALWSAWNGLVNLYRPDLIDYPLNFLEGVQAGLWLVNQVRRGG